MADAPALRIRTALPCACALAALVLAAAAPAPSHGADGDAPRPVLLILPGGGFFFDVDSMPFPARVARRLGFRPRFVDYPEHDLPGAVAFTRRAALRAGRGGREVYAYGESAGGTLAALLAQGRLVRAASTYCPIADLRALVDDHPEGELYQTLISATDRDLQRFSPLRHNSEGPIRALAAAGDARFINRAIASWDRADRDVSSVSVPGPHLLDPYAPEVYRGNVRLGLAWVARKAGL